MENLKELFKNKKVIIGAAAALVIIVGIAVWMIAESGDSSNGKVSGSSSEVLNTMQKAKEAFENVSSVHSILEINMNMQVQDAEMNMALQMGVYQNKSEDIQKTETVISLGDFGSQAITTYIDLKNDISYTTEDGGMSWKKEEIDGESAFASADNGQIFDILTGIRNYEENGSETINGIAAVRYDGFIEKETLKDMINNTGILEQIGTDGLSDAKINEICDKIGEIGVSVLIDPNTNLPQKMSMDLTKLVKETLEVKQRENADDSGESKGSESAADSLKQCTMTYTLTDYNKLTPIEIPQEAKKA